MPTITAIIIIAVVFAIIKISMENDLKKKYDAALRSGNRAAALKAGRAYYASKRGGKLTTVDEQSIANDMSTM